MRRKGRIKMPKLVHKHLPPDKFPKVAKSWTDADSGWVVISQNGGTIIYSGGFSGCIGVVMCSSRKWGAMAHMNQMQQNPSQSLEFALSTIADFIRKQTTDKIVDVLLFYGDPGENLGERQGSNLTIAKVKEVMQCENVIDLRRKTSATPHGSDFIYDPSLQVVYTATTGTACDAAGLSTLDDKFEVDKSSKKKAFPYPKEPENAKTLLKFLGHKGWCILP